MASGSPSPPDGYDPDATDADFAWIDDVPDDLPEESDDLFPPVTDADRAEWQRRQEAP